MEKSFAGHFLKLQMSFFLRRLARSVVPCAQICAFVLLVSTMLVLRAWGDDLVAVLFEFLDDDAKLAQSCTDWLYVQHWYTVRSGRSWEQVGIVTSIFKTHRPIYSFSVEKKCISEMTERCLLGEKRVLQPCTRLPLFRNLFMFLRPLACGHFGSEVSCGSSMAPASCASHGFAFPCAVK